MFASLATIALLLFAGTSDGEAALEGTSTAGVAEGKAALLTQWKQRMAALLGKTQHGQDESLVAVSASNKASDVSQAVDMALEAAKGAKSAIVHGHRMSKVADKAAKAGSETQKQLAATKETSKKAWKKLTMLKAETSKIKSQYSSNVAGLRKKWKTKLLALSTKSKLQHKKLSKDVTKEKKAKKEVKSIKAKDKKAQHIILGESKRIAAEQESLKKMHQQM